MITALQAQDMNPWLLAQELGICYTGDMSPFDHGGTFYSIADWEHGYASCVRFERVEGRTLVEYGTINRCDDDMNAAHDYCDTPDEFRETVVGQVEACLFHGGVETAEDFGGRYLEWFDEDQESAAWEQAINWIRGLSSEA